MMSSCFVASELPRHSTDVASRDRGLVAYYHYDLAKFCVDVCLSSF
jgi:hypothetical protein